MIFHAVADAANDLAVLAASIAGRLALEPPLHIRRQSDQQCNGLALGTHVSNSDSSDIDKT
jgi:hypothetical protein